MTFIFNFKRTLKCRLQFVSILTILKFYRLVMGKVKLLLEYTILGQSRLESCVLARYCILKILNV